MANDVQVSSTGGVSFTSLLALLFIGLKLGGVINWSWWWVTLPLWGGLALFTLFAIVAVLFIALKGVK